MIYLNNYTSPLGTITMASNGQYLTGLWIENQKYFADTIKHEKTIYADIEIFDKTKNWLDSYFAKQNPDINKIPLLPEGSDYRKAVWKQLINIPYGKTATYQQIAKQAADYMHKSSSSARAAGGAIGHNPISIIIPCHRVIGSNDSLTGYAGGLDIKIKLLELEGIHVKSGFIVK